MKKKILITGAGGVALPAIIEKLQKRGFMVYAVDIDPYASGLYLADKAYIIPPASSPDFLPVILDICKKEKIEAVVPLVDEELAKCSELEKYNIVVVTPRLDFITMCLDKYNLMKRLEKNNILVPATRLANADIDTFKYPLIVKPRVGRGSRDVQIVKTREELDIYLKRTCYEKDKIIIQEYIRGKEYTVSVVVWRDGVVRAVVPKEIISKKGITHIAITRKNSLIEDVSFKIQNMYRADGPFNIQLKFDIKNNRIYIFEINPRFSTTVTLTITSGVDEISMLLNQALKVATREKPAKWKEGVVLFRKTTDSYMSEEEFKYISKRINISYLA